MPGIAGLVTKLRQAEAERQLHAMMGTLRHEPFYSCGTWSDPEQGIYAGWTARQGSLADGMPFRSEDGEVTLFFSGEEFPEPFLKRALRDRGHQFPDGDASYLAHRY